MGSNVEQFYGVRFESEVEQAILWQYNAAPNIQGLVTEKETWLKGANSAFWCWYLFNYFYLPLADNYGIVIWSILLDLGVTTSTPPNINNVWGFGSYNQNFGWGNFGSLGGSVVSLPLPYARAVLLMRYFDLTTNATVPNINAFMNKVIVPLLYPNQPSNTIVVADNYDMTITYHLNFTPDQFLRYIMQNMDLLPRPAGVGVSWTSYNPESFGFGPGMQNFEHGTFSGG